MELKTLEKKESLGNFSTQNSTQDSTQEMRLQKSPRQPKSTRATETKSIKPTWEILLCMGLPQVDQHSAFRIGQVLYMEDSSCRFDPDLSSNTPES